MTRDEAITKIAAADGAEGRLFRNGQWGAALVDSLAVLGLLKFEEPASQIDRDEGRYAIRLHADEWTAAAKQGGASRLSEKIIQDMEREGFKIVKTAIDDEAAALEHLQGYMAEIKSPPSLRATDYPVSVAGCLTGYGAGCVIDALRIGGFKIVRSDTP